MTVPLSPEVRQLILKAQRAERTEHLVYHRLAQLYGDTDNGRVLERISRDELAHYRFWATQTGTEVAPDRVRAGAFTLVARLLGLTFAVKLMERGEESAQVLYESVAATIPQAKQVADEEEEHEHALLGMLDEERLRYIGSMVLGLSDALVELTGTLAGLTLALQNTRLIASAGLITGISASLSMAASEFLSTQSQDDELDPKKASLYTGAAYVATVVLLILPFLLLKGYMAALGVSLAVAMVIVLAFTYYVSVARDMPFGRRFAQMAGISLGVAVLSFCIGYLVREVLGIEI